MVKKDNAKNPHAVALGRLGGIASTAARMEKISPEKRKEIAHKASKAAIQARKRIPPSVRSEIAKKASAARWANQRKKTQG